MANIKRVIFSNTGSRLISTNNGFYEIVGNDPCVTLKWFFQGCNQPIERRVTDLKTAYNMIRTGNLS